ncbi:MAG: 3-oxoacyl-ACP reductase FabG [Bacillota bacterium]
MRRAHSREVGREVITLGLLDGKVALVTGAARGIGRATALGLAEDGAHVVVADLNVEGVRQTAAEVAALGRKAVGVYIDIASSDLVKQAFEQARAELGPVDILVNNAAITTNVAVIRKMQIKDWERELAVNLTGAFNCIREALNGMVTRKWGRIINISSGAGALGGYGQAGYASTKAGILGLTKTVALEHARDGITCNAILPGLIQTDAADAINPEMRARITRRIPLRELGRPEDIAYVVAFLASDRARYINGAELNVSAGQELFTY